MVLWGGCPFKHTASLWGGVQTPQVDVLLLGGGCPPQGDVPSLFLGGGSSCGLRQCQSIVLKPRKYCIGVLTSFSVSIGKSIEKVLKYCLTVSDGY